MYYADGVPDIASLIQLIDSAAASIPNLNDATLIDYTLQKAFPFQRSMSSFADRVRILLAIFTTEMNRPKSGVSQKPF